MARLFTFATSDYLEVASTPIANYPFTLACWFYTDSITTSETLIQIRDSAVPTMFHRLALAGHVANDPILAESRIGLAQAFTSTSFTANTWHHACGVFSANNARAAFLNGAGKVINTGTSNDTGFDGISVGRSGDSSPGAHMSGRIAEAAIWNIALTDDEVAILAKGYSPLFVRPQNLVIYWPLIRDEDQDRVGGYDLTAFNTPTIAPHPPVLYPAP